MDLLRPGRNVWRVETAARAAVLIDAAAFFKAVRSTCLKARRSILVIGWDIDGRTRLVGEEGQATDGYASAFARFLGELVAERPELEVLPRLSLDWTTPERVALCIDDTVPFGSSPHQKIVVVDDAVAFCGGLDLTVRRWDNPAHAPYRPVHDVQVMVDGPAAQSLALLARERWCRASDGAPLVTPVGDPWPDDVAPDFTDVAVGMARTQPRFDDEEPVREAETLFLDAIDAAEREIYIENPFLTSALVADRLAGRLAACPDLQVVIVAPRSHEPRVERRTTSNGRIRFWRRVREAGGERVRLVYPAIAEAGRASDIMVHSKVMIVDDRFLRVGSANLDNRSMGAETECDLAIEARSEAERTAIRSIRDRLLAEHCGVSAGEVEAARRRGARLLDLADSLAGQGHCLKPIEDGEPDGGVLPGPVERVADPACPVRPGRFLRHLAGRLRPLLMVAGGLLAILGIALAWRHAGLSGVLTADNLRAVLHAARGEPWAIVVVCAVFVMAGLMVFPLNVLLLTTAAVFGPLLGIAYGAAGALSSGIVLFWIGRKLGRNTLERIAGPRVQKVLAGVRRRGLVTVVTFRLLPIAPFTLVNLAAGAGGIRFVDFVAGTAIGLAPGLVLLSIMGDRILRILSDPSAGDIGILLLCVAGLIGLALGAQSLLSRGGRGA